MEQLSVRRFTRAVVYPTIRVASHPNRLLMGAFDDAGAYIEGSALDRRSGEIGAPIPRDLFPDVADAPTPTAIYAGTLYFHYGHFLLESLARAWYARQHPEIPFVWAGAHTWADKTLVSWQREILDILGITNPTVILSSPTRFDDLHVPDIGYRYDDRFHPDHAAFLGAYRGPSQEAERRIWLSRGGIGTDVRDINAGAIERRLEREGWGIVHPEALGVREQLDELSRASIVAGEEGSAFHTLILLADIAGKRFEMFRRHGEEHRNIRTIGDARMVDQRLHTIVNEKVLKAEGRAVVKVSANSAEVLDALGIPLGVDTVPPLEARTRRRLQALAGAVGARSVLDVGGIDASHAAATAAERRVVVSGRLEVDPRRLAHDKVTAFETDLDTFVSVFRGKGRFDLVHLRAETATERLRDFGASLPAAHERTVWHLGSDETAMRAAVAIADRFARVRIVRAADGRTTTFVALRSLAVVDEAGDVDALSARSARRAATAFARIRERHASWWIAYALRRPGAIPIGHAWRTAIRATVSWIALIPSRAYRLTRRLAGRVLRRLGLRR